MNTKTLGLIGMLTSPFLAIDFIVNGIIKEYHPNSLSGIFSFIYMTGWLGCIVALYNSKANGYKRSGSIIMIIQLCMLLLAEGWNVYVIIQPDSNSIVVRILDIFWPISNCFMLVTGISVITAKVLEGWRRYIPLMVGLWLPVSILASLLAGRNSMTAVLISCAYSAISWFLLGLSVYLGSRRNISFKMIAPYVYKPV
jgi:hypothetical protein